MEIIHAFSKLKIETTDHSSSQEIEEEEEEEEEEKAEEDKRNWLELPPDVTSLIFLKLGAVDILASAQWVCSSWWKLSKQPHLFRSIHVENVSTIFGYNRNLDVPNNFMAVNKKKVNKKKKCKFLAKLSVGLVREAIDRSCGQLVEFSVRAVPVDELLLYMSEKSSSLRSLRLVEVALVEIDYGYNDDIGENEYIANYEFVEEIAKKLPHLEELEIIKCLKISKVLTYVIKTFGRFCPQLKSCRLSCGSCFVHRIQFVGVALAIAENMPQLRHLNLFGNPMTHDALGVIIDGCPHLESLDLRGCFNFNLGQDLKERCKNIKVLRLPNDPTDDFEFDFDDEYGPYGDDYGSDYSTVYVTNSDGDYVLPNSDFNFGSPFKTVIFGYHRTLALSGGLFDVNHPPLVVYNW